MAVPLKYYLMRIFHGSYFQEYHISRNNVNTKHKFLYNFEVTMINKTILLNLKRYGNIPSKLCLDKTLSLLLEGYLFIPNRRRKYKRNLFQTRLMGRQAVCISGKQAAELFYDQNLFTRRNVIPKRIQETLFGKKSIQTLTGKAHMHRKQMFLSIMSPDKVQKLITIFKQQLPQSFKRLETKNEIILFDEATIILFRAACKWAGVPIENTEIKQRAQDMSSMIDAFGAVGPRHIIGRCARNRSEYWAQALITEVRSGKLIAPTDTALSEIAWHKDLNGRLLCTEVAAVELLNILRPITAIATYITFGALALNKYPNTTSELQAHNEEYLNMFAQEVRRYYPFAPFLGAKVRVNFKWQDYYFKKGTLVFLDIYGTNHDSSIWDKPNAFMPEHFKNRAVGPFDFIPQGGGDYKAGTRCPGEFITVEILKVFLNFMVNDLSYDVPTQDFHYPLNRIPTLPKDKFIINNVKLKQTSQLAD
jgi:fatty-acid peroxygenase